MAKRSGNPVNAGGNTFVRDSAVTGGNALPLTGGKMGKAPVKERKKRGKRKKTLLVLTAALLALVLGCAAYLRLTDMSRFVDTFYELEDDKIEGPLRIVLLTDLHLHEFGPGNSELTEEIARLKPDLIAMAGDMMNEDDPDVSAVLALCRPLVDVAPVYFSYGNHEKQAIRVNQTSTLNVDLEAMGVHVLHNRWETVQVKGNTIDIGGLSANPGTMQADYTQKFWKSYLESPNYRLLLVHYPNYFFSDGELAGEKIDMALCGHLHGGQIVIPGIGGLYHPSTGFFPEMTDGCHRVGDTWVIISRGLGNTSRIPRVNNPPELVIVDVY